MLYFFRSMDCYLTLPISELKLQELVSEAKDFMYAIGKLIETWCLGVYVYGIYYTMLTSLMHNALILSGGRGYRPSHRQRRYSTFAILPPPQTHAPCN